MKYLKISIYIACLIIYVFSAYMTAIEPNNNLWGYICTFVFVFMAIIAVIQYVNNLKKKEK